MTAAENSQHQPVPNDDNHIIQPTSGWQQATLPITASRLFMPLTGLAATMLGLAACGVLQYLMPQHGSIWLGMQLLLLAIGAVTLGVVLFRIRHYLMEPLAHLRDWAQRMRSGNLSTRIPVPAHGEFAELARDINSLADALKTLSEDMDSQVRKQTDRIAQKTRSLEVLYDVAASINVSRDLDDLLSRFLHTMIDVVSARAACVRLRDDDDMMRLVASIGLDDKVIKENESIPIERCLCGTVLDGDNTLRLPTATAVGETEARKYFNRNDIEMISVPLQYRDSILGIYNLFIDRHELIVREDVTGLLTSLGRHLGMAIEKAHMDKEANLMSIMQERTTLAHELHDSLAQTLASLRFQVRVLDETLQQSGGFTAIQEIEQVENSLDEAYLELRELIAHFRAPMDRRGLIPAVEGLVNRFRSQTGIATFLQIIDWENDFLPANLEMHVMRIIQESLANIRKHSQAKNVRVMLRRDAGDNFMVLIEDDGVGMGEPAISGSPGEHIGLSIMQDRARHLGGVLHIESEPGEGTSVVLNFHQDRFGKSTIPNLANIH